MIITAPPTRRIHLDLLDWLTAVGLMDEELGEELAMPQGLFEPAEVYAARTAARADITADLIDEYLAGSCGDEWFETTPAGWPDREAA